MNRKNLSGRRFCNRPKGMVWALCYLAMLGLFAKGCSPANKNSDEIKSDSDKPVRTKPIEGGKPRMSDPTLESSPATSDGENDQDSVDSSSASDVPALSERVGETQLRLDPPPPIRDHRLENGWPTFRGNPLANGVATSSLVAPTELEIIWSHRVQRAEFSCTACLTTIDERATVVIGDLDGLVLALDLEDGRPLWSFEIKFGYACSVAYHEGHFFVGNLDGKFICLDSKGNLQWEYQAGSQVDGSATFYDDLVLFTSQDSYLYALNRHTGELAWSVAGGDQLRCAPTIHQSQVFLAGCDAILHGIRLDDQSSSMEIEIESPTGSTPAVMGNVLYFGTMQAGFKAVDVGTQEVIWTFDNDRQSLEFAGNAAVTPEVIVVGEKSRRVWGLHPETGEVVWQQTVSSAVETSPVVVGNVVYVASKDGRLWAFERLTGEILWQREFRGRFNSSPAVGYERLVIATDDGNIYCLGPAN